MPMTSTAAALKTTVGRTWAQLLSPLADAQVRSQEAELIARPEGRGAGLARSLAGDFDKMAASGHSAVGSIIALVIMLATVIT